MNKMKKYIIIGLFWMSIMPVALSQIIIDTAHFRLNFKPSVGHSQKINLPVEIKDTTSNKVDFSYEILPLRPTLTFTSTVLKPQKVSPDITKKLYRNFLKVGFGFPLNPYLQLSIHNPDNSKYSYGLNIYHNSNWLTVGKEMKKYADAYNSDSRVHLFFNRFFKYQTLYSSIDYNHKFANLYGYNKDSLRGRADIEDVNRYYTNNYHDSINNSFHHLNAEIGLRSNYVLEDKKLKQDLRLNYDFLYTYKKDMENHIGLTSYFAYDARFMRISGSQNYKMGVNFDYYNNQFKDSLDGRFPRTQHSFKVEFKPTMSFTIKEYHLLLGVGVPIVHNYGRPHVPVYPIVDLQLGLVPGIMSMYVGLNGQVQFNSLQSLLYDNPFVKPQLDSLKFTCSQFGVQGGVKGNIYKKMNYNISARYSMNKDYVFYQIDTTAFLRNRFSIIYRDVNIFNACLNLNWEVLDHLYLNFEGNYWGYFFNRVEDSLHNQQHAWYKPSLDFTFNGSYVWNQKMIFNFNCNLQLMRWAQVPTSSGVLVPTKMKPLLNFGLGFEYFITKHFTVFIELNNIAFQHYAQYYDFKAYGGNVLVGITYSFGNESLKMKKK
jgi:hypothetical protein